MAVDSTREVTQLLQDWRSGEDGALDRLMPMVYTELHALAERYLRRERVDHTLQPTALIHEAFLRLVGMDVPWQDRTHFRAVAARAMRRILVDHAKAKGRAKRGGGAARVTLDEALLLTPEPTTELIDLDAALTRLAEIDPRKSRIIELQYFGGLTYDETAEAVGISPATVHRELRMAKAWLHQQLS